MLDRVPTSDELITLFGEQLFSIWLELCFMIEEKYDIDMIWNSGGSAWKYEYKYHRGGKVLCALYAKENCFNFMIILGRNEREKFESNKNIFSSEIQKVYDESDTYHEGKCIMFELKDRSLFEDIEKLLHIKMWITKKYLN